MNRAGSVSVAAVLAVFSLCGLAPRVEAELLTFPEKPVDSQLLAFKNAIGASHKKALTSRKPWSEESLRKRVPSKYLKLETRYARIKDREVRARALAQLALVYSELAWVERIRPILETLKELDSSTAARVGFFAESEHFLVRVVGASSNAKWAEAALKLGEAAHGGYLKLFRFSSISKVPGKKIRILIHVDPGLKRTRLYFHPTPLYHGELRYEMSDEKYLTLAGRQRVVYGFCHELGHMLAMWGKYKVVEDDKHAWAHYTGSLVVEQVYEKLGNEPWPTWTSFQRRASGKARLLTQIEGQKSGSDSYESILTLFYEIGEEFGTECYGRAWSWLETKKRFRKINHVPYLWLRDLEDALANGVPEADAARVRELFGKRSRK